MIAADAVSQAHRQAVQAPISEVARLLQELLSRRVTAYLAGDKDGKTVARWVSGQVTDVRDDDTARRLRTAYEIAILLLQFDSSQVVRTWFISLNPELNDDSPIEAIHDGLLREALAAARAFVVGA
jgi:hypothetical protein